jgi:hypothetical protein
MGLLNSWPQMRRFKEIASRKAYNDDHRGIGGVIAGHEAILKRSLVQKAKDYDA